MVKSDGKENSEEEEAKLTDIPGIGPGIAAKLEAAGIYDLMGLAVMSPAALSELAGIGEAVARKAIQTARGMMKLGFVSGDEFAKNRENIIYITTGSKNLNGLLGGRGVETKAITETYGSFGSGKTQLGLSLAVNVQLPKEQGGANGKAVFIDTEGSLPYDEIVLLEIDGKLQFRKIGEIVEEMISNSKNKEEINGSISVADNPKKILAISFDPDTYKIGKFEITGFIKHPVKKIFRVKLSSGREVKTTEYHNFFSLNDCGELNPIYLRNLKKGEFVAIPALIPEADQAFQISEEEAEFFGLYVAEGSMIPDDRYKTGHYLAIITSKEKGAEEIVKKFCEKRGHNYHRNKLDYRIYSKSLTEELKSCYEFSPYNSHTKKIPNFILNSSFKVKNSFMRGYLFGDGSFNRINNTQNADTVSRFLASDLLYLNASLGIPARNQQIFREGRNSRGGPSQTYNIHWVVDKKKDRTLELLPNNNYQIRRLLKKIRLEQNKNQKDLSPSKTATFMSIIESGICNSVGRSKLAEILSNLENSETVLKLKKIINSDIWFDKILSIEEIGEEVCYDFEVAPGKKVENFIGGYGGIFLHNTFRPERIRQIAEGIRAEPDKVLKNILVARAFNSDHQILLLDKINEMIKEGEPIKLVIIDSLTAHFRAEFTGRGQLADRQQKLNRYLHNLMKLAEQNNLAVYVTNQVMANPGMMFGDPTTPVGGNIVGHMCLNGDSLIQLADGGLIEVEKMKQQQVLSASFDSMKFNSANSEHVFVNPDVNNIYTIKTNGQINCSGLHRFFSVGNFEVIEKEAKELKEGDFIAQAAEIEIEGEDVRVPEFKVRRIGALEKKSTEKVKMQLEESKITKEGICKNIGITPRQLRRVLNQEWPTSVEVLDKLEKHSGNLVLEVMPILTYKHGDLIMPEFMTASFAQIFGYFIGSGNLEKRGIRFRDARYEVLEHYNKLFIETFNLGGRITKLNGKNCYNLDINSREVSDLFVLLLPHIYDYIGRSKKETVLAFVKGFVDAEGHVNKKRAYISVSQRNPKVLRYLQLFLLRVGIGSTIKFGVGGKNINILRIIDKDIRGYLQVGFTASDKQKTFLEKIKEIEEKYNYEMMPIRREELAELIRTCGLKPYSIIRYRPASYQFVSRKELESVFTVLMSRVIKDRQAKQKVDFIFRLLQGKFKFERIKGIRVEENKARKELYDFSVPGMENYIADGFIVHNSTYRLYFRRGKAGSRVAKMIDAPNLPENETVFFLTEKGVRDEG